MKKKVVLRISFILILAIMFSVNAPVSGIRANIRENPIPLAPEPNVTAKQDKTSPASPQTGDNMSLFNILALMSLTVVIISVIRYKSESDD